MAVLVVWLLAAAGWGAVAAGLRRGLSGFARRTALIAHALAAPGLILLCAVLGFGSLYGTITLAAEWWALALVTGFRPERLVSPAPGALARAPAGLARLAAWSAAVAVAVPLAGAFVFRL